MSQHRVQVEPDADHALHLVPIKRGSASLPRRDEYAACTGAEMRRNVGWNEANKP